MKTPLRLTLAVLAATAATLAHAYQTSLYAGCGAAFEYDVVSLSQGDEGIIVGTEARGVGPCWTTVEILKVDTGLGRMGILVSALEITLTRDAPDEPNPLDDQLTPGGFDFEINGGWVHSLAAGWLYAKEYPWLWLPNQGWLYVESGPTVHYIVDQAEEISEEDTLDVFLLRLRAKADAIPSLDRPSDFISNSYYFWSPTQGWLWKAEPSNAAFSYQANDWIEW